MTEHLAVHGEQVIDGTGAAPIPDGMVLIEDGRIREVGRASRLTLPTGTEVSFTTEDADADHAELRARGVEADEAVMRMGDLVPPMFTFRDPDGNRFRMVERP